MRSVIEKEPKEDTINQPTETINGYDSIELVSPNNFKK